MNTKEIVELLEKLLSHLYADKEPPTILTRKDIQFYDSRPQALEALSQAEEINRENDSLRALCGFHVGIIYLDWGDLCSASQQFSLAYKHWGSMHSITRASQSKNYTSYYKASGCLADFARGCIHELESDYKKANYKKASHAYSHCQNTLSELITPPSDFINAMQKELEDAQKRIRLKLWTELKKNNQPTGSQTHQTNPGASTTPEQDSNAAPSDDTRPPDSQPDAPMPVINMNTDKRPFSPLFSPIPNHTNNGPYKWYSVHNIENDSFLDIETDTYLLVDTSHADKYNEDEWLLIKNGDNGGSITLRPFPPKAPFERIYLAEVIQIGIFERGIFNGTVKFSPTRERNNIKQLDVIGIVIGIWQAQIRATA